jgi:16S rRNA (cytosine1402-N4)-methyltransferase
MRMDPRGTTTATSLLRRLPESDLAYLLQTYGEERWARRIAKHLVAVRRRTPIETTTQLTRLVAEAVPPQAGPRRIHPATRTFQALRMAVNEELASLELLLAALPKVLRSGGRAVIITFHSLEDRLVKQAFRRGEQAGLWKLLMKKPLTPSEREVDENPRSRSAKLRAVEKL